MSKLMTDSPTLMSWFEMYGDDCKLYALIDALKEAVVETTALQIEILDDTCIGKLQSINRAIVGPLRDLQKVREELKDILEK